MIRPRPLAPFAVLLILAAGCQRPPPPTRADAQARADCRETVDREYSAQNRADLTRRDERDYAFAGTYNSGLVSRGMGAQYQVDQMITDCLRASGDKGGQAVPGVGPVFSPAERGAGTPSLQP